MTEGEASGLSLRPQLQRLPYSLKVKNVFRTLA
jgi:hypothetical protein